MNATTTPVSGNNTTTIVLGLLATLLVFAVLTGRKLPLIGSDRAALVTLVVIGMAMCTTGIGRVAASGAWAHPLAIAGYILGALILGIAIAGFFGWTLPYISSARQAIVVVSLLAVMKLAVSFLHKVI